MITGVAIATIAAGAYAQTTGTPAAVASGTAPSDTTQVQEFVVTGSRIPQPNLTSISPVTAVSGQELKISGTSRVEDLINQLPQVIADQGGGISNGASGTATVSLRDLGPNRTLVLIDGTRLGPGDPGLPVADLNRRRLGDLRFGRRRRRRQFRHEEGLRRRTDRHQLRPVPTRQRQRGRAGL
jgi:outer membrane receptor protein involved in Fe transport